MSWLAHAVNQGFFHEIVKIADSFSGGVDPVGARAPVETTPSPTPSNRPRHTPMASERAEHLTDIAGLGMMGLASADELREALTGTQLMGSTGRDIANLAGLATMAVPSIQAVRHLRQGGKGNLAGGGSKGGNLVNIAGLTALGLPIVDRLQAKFRGDPEEGRFLSDRASALMELGGYGALAGNLYRNKTNIPAADKHEHQAINRQLLGYGILAAPELTHALEGEHPEHPNYDAQGNPLPAKPSVLRPITDMVGLSLLGQPVLGHLRHK